MDPRSLFISGALVGAAVLLFTSLSRRTRQPAPKAALPKLRAPLHIRPDALDHQAMHDFYDRVSFGG